MRSTRAPKPSRSARAPVRCRTAAPVASTGRYPPGHPPGPAGPDATLRRRRRSPGCRPPPPPAAAGTRGAATSPAPAADRTRRGARSPRPAGDTTPGASPIRRWPSGCPRRRPRTRQSSRWARAAARRRRRRRWTHPPRRAALAGMAPGLPSRWKAAVLPATRRPVSRFTCLRAALRSTGVPTLSVPRVPRHGCWRPAPRIAGCAPGRSGQRHPAGSSRSARPAGRGVADPVAPRTRLHAPQAAAASDRAVA